ncbi:MAG: bifunctional riboflavin kinase/FMN adenylyltransferase [Legionella sp.]|nr:MAG: bifunctional riboflavin kinase/FMN adenylyltransferase [Legionella sp.]PJD99393.1 MAG: bifunctional riboflavin kinase/FMN adenylyltransferase [Legionella sp.]
MKLLHSEKQLRSLCIKGAVATIGNFDGVHLGHQTLLKTVRQKATALHLPLIVVLFEPQPKEYFQKSDAPARLSTLREKIQHLKECGVDYVYCIKFNQVMASTAAEQFIKQHVIDALNTKYLLVGDDFRFGKNREGSFSLLRTLCESAHCEVEIFPELRLMNNRVSSTTIRTFLQQGLLDKAKSLLGRSYSMCGRVIKGDGRGRQWGIPTLNIGLHRLSLPLSGVFVVEVLLQSQKVYGVANIGKRPTVDGTKNVLEVHLFHFNKSVYGEFVQVFFLHKLRNEVKFTSVESLIDQIHVDIAAAAAYLDLNTAKI